MNVLKKKSRFIFYSLICCIACLSTSGQSSLLECRSTDTALQGAFYRAKEMALSYRGDPNDPIGPWYEAALPARNAFCVRDVSHQCIGAETLGMSQENKNMLRHFVSNISASKDWCTYWEINKFGKPAPEDYRNDTAFWYNLNANFELIYTCWRLYEWTGDTSYIADPVFRKFFDRTVNEYVNKWYLQEESLLNRPAYPNAPASFDIHDNFYRCRGIPSYYEAVEDMKMSADLVAAIYRAFTCYAAIADWRGENKTAMEFVSKAETYRKHLEKHWWDETAGVYQAFYTNKGVFGKGEGETFLLWYDALNDSSRIRKTINHLTDVHWNVENLSYLPYQLTRFGYGDKAYQYILYLTNPSTKRREYPEVSFGVMEGIVQGIMGVAPDAANKRITTLYSHHPGDEVEISNLPVLATAIQLKHWDKGSSFTNAGGKIVTWRACFHGRLPYLLADGKKIKTIQQIDTMGNWKSYVDIRVQPGKKVSVAIP